MRYDQAFNAEYIENETDPIKLSLEDYDYYQKMKPRRPFYR